MIAVIKKPVMPNPKKSTIQSKFRITKSAALTIIILIITVFLPASLSKFYEINTPFSIFNPPRSPPAYSGGP